MSNKFYSALRSAKETGVPQIRLRDALDGLDENEYTQALLAEKEPFVTEISTDSTGISKCVAKKGRNVKHDFSLAFGDDLLSPSLNAR